MVFPTTATSLLILFAVSLLLLGSWANTFKAAKKLRFELYYVDFVWGSLVAAIVAAFTLGSWIPSELTFQDNFLLTGYRNMAWALVAGGLVGLGNMFLLGSTSVAGLATAFPICFGVSWAIDSLISYFSVPTSSITVAIGGALILLVVVLISFLAYRGYLEEVAEAKIKALNVDPRTEKRIPKPRGPLKGTALGIAAGVFYSGVMPCIQNAMVSDLGISGYGTSVLMAAAIFGSSILYLVFFMNFPVAGPPLAFTSYFRITKAHHMFGFLGGFLWMAGMVSMLVGFDVDGIVFNPVNRYMLTHGAPVVTMLWGLFIWREMPRASLKVKLMRLGALVLFLVGLGLVATLPLSSAG